MTLKDIYKSTQAEPTPTQAFVASLAEATGVSVLTAQRWCSGAVMPSAPARKLIAQHLGIEEFELFPEIHEEP